MGRLPDSISEQIAPYNDAVGGFEIASMQVNFAGLPYDIASRSLDLFGRGAPAVQHARRHDAVRLALFDSWRVGVIDVGAQTITDVTGAVPGAGDADPLGAGWWVRMCRDFEDLRPRLDDARSRGHAVPLGEVRLRPPVLNPGKVVATVELRQARCRDPRGRARASRWPRRALAARLRRVPEGDVVGDGPGDAVVFPSGPEAAGREIHHESELAVVMVAAARRSAQRRRSTMCSATPSGST